MEGSKYLVCTCRILWSCISLFLQLLRLRYKYNSKKNHGKWLRREFIKFSKLKIFLTPKSAHIEILKKIKELAILYLNPI